MNSRNPIAALRTACAGALLLAVFAADAQIPGTQRVPTTGKATPAALPATAGSQGPVASPEVFFRAEDRDISVLVVPGDETTLSSQMAGKVKKIGFGLGESIPAGAVVLEFDCSEQIAQLGAAEAELRGARDTHLSKLRLQALGAAGELEVSVAASNADKLKSQVDWRQSQLAYCAVVAPFSGRLAKMRVKPAESVALGQPLLEMVNSGSLKAQLYVPASWLQWMRPGTRFVVKVNDEGRSYRAKVAKLNSRVEGVSQTLEIEGRFEGPTQGLLPGMVGTAVFPDRPVP